MKRSLTAALVTATAVAVLAVPAGAAVPTKPAKVTVPCNDGSGDSARVWHTTSKGRLTKLAADNPCTGWLALNYGLTYGSGAARDQLTIAPGAHFNWGKKRIAAQGARGPVWGVRVVPMWGCMGPTTIHLLYSYRDVRPADSC